MEHEREARKPIEAVISRPDPRGSRRRREQEDREGLTLVQLAWTVFERRWTVVAITSAFIAAAAAYLFVASPTYRSSVLVQIAGGKKALPGLEDVSAAFEDSSPADAEIRIMQSRTAAESVVDQLGLDIQAHPRRLPIVGAAIARRHRGAQPAPAPFGLVRYGWGGERIRVDRLSVPGELVGRPLVLTALGDGGYQVSEGGTVLLRGRVGAVARGDSPAGPTEMLVGELVARPGTELWVTKLSREDVVAELQQALRIEEKVAKTGVVEVTLEGPEPARVAVILRALSQLYVRQSLERRSADAAKMLEFLNGQLPMLKGRMERAEAALNQFRTRRGTVNLPAEIQATLTSATDLDKSIADLEVQRAELLRRYTSDHPDVAPITQKIEMLKAQRGALDSRLEGLPSTELQAARLNRDVTVSTTLYLNLLAKSQQIQLGKAGALGDVHVVDPPAVPKHPASPNSRAVLLLAMLGGLGCGIAVSLARASLNQGIEDPDEVEGATGLTVFGTIPRSETEIGLARGRGRRRRARRLAPLSVADPGDPAVEDLRSLRTAVQFALRGSRNGIVAIEGPAPAVGKSFVCVNLAHLLAAAERRVLLVDADLRGGELHRYFGLDPGPGLAEAASGAVVLDAAIRRTDVPSLDLLPTGALPEHPAELLASTGFESLLAEAALRYDVILIDTPPVLSVTDAALVGRHAGVNLLVLRSGRHAVKEITLAVDRLAQSGVAVDGAILNDTPTPSGRYGRYGEYRRYDRYRRRVDAAARTGRPS
jgi:tyrosine-protein kinase Etk/Wzc